MRRVNGSFFNKFLPGTTPGSWFKKKTKKHPIVVHVLELILYTLLVCVTCTYVTCPTVLELISSVFFHLLPKLISLDMIAAKTENRMAAKKARENAVLINAKGMCSLNAFE